jgi:hypothetical protein
LKANRLLKQSKPPVKEKNTAPKTPKLLSSLEAAKFSRRAEEVNWRFFRARGFI